jgi:phage tail sheath gpL-like
MAIQFNTIPIDLRSSGQYVEYNNSRAGRALVGMPAKVLLIGQKTTAGTMAALTPTRIPNVAAAAALCGRGSMLWAMADVYKAADPHIDLWAVAIDDDAAATAAAGTATFNAAAPVSGLFSLRIDGVRVRIAVSAGQSVSSMAAALAGAVNADDSLPVTAAAALGVVTLTCRWKGETGNDIPLILGHYPDEILPVGLDFTLVAMAGGQANPDVGQVIAAVAGDWYTDVVCPYTDLDNIIQLEAEGERRWAGTVMTDTHFYMAKHGTYGDLATFGNARNSPNCSFIGAKDSPNSPWKWAAALAGICAFEFKQDPARPVQTLMLPRTKIKAPPIASRFDLDAREVLLHDGISTWNADDDGSVRLDNVITSYQRNASGYEDTSYLQIETVKTLAALRYSMRARIAQRFPRHKAASDSFEKKPGQFVARPQDIRNELIALAGDWQAAGLVEDIRQFKEELLVERDDNPDRFNAIVPPNLINQFRIFAARIDFIN